MFQPHGYGPVRLMKDALVDCFANGLHGNDVLVMPEPVYFGGTVDRSVGSREIVCEIERRGRQMPESFRQALSTIYYALAEAAGGDDVLRYANTIIEDAVITAWSAVVACGSSPDGLDPFPSDHHNGFSASDADRRRQFDRLPNARRGSDPLDNLPADRQSAAMIKVGDRVFTAAGIDRLHHRKAV
jgi:hypothetical protein